MNTAQTDERVAGRELDAEVAEKVMGIEDVWLDHGFALIVHLDGPNEKVPPYSTDIAAAWQVVEHLTNEERGFELWRENMAFREYEATFYPDAYQRWVARAETAPLAICRAALAAVSS